ncbi:MAG: hypothetical protein ABFD80_07455, partial [Acidobacteriota bacterium]
AGCRVHPRRPLVCRLYPLGRATDGHGEETFALFPGQPGCAAVVGGDGTIGTFLEAQGVGPYLEWSRRYGRLYRRMMEILDRLDIQGEIEASAAGEAAGPEGPAEPAGADGASLSSWQDIDASLAEYCTAKGLPVPPGIEEAIALHIRAMEEWLDDLQARVGGAGSGPEGAPGT